MPLSIIELAEMNEAKIKELESLGYSFNEGLTCSYSAVVLSKDEDIYVFDWEGNVLHNPETISFTVY